MKFMPAGGWARIVVVIPVLLGSVVWESSASAQKLVVARFTSRRAASLAKRARLQLLRQLKANGFKLVSYGYYLKRARRYRLRGARALRPRGIARMCRKLGLDGVITGHAIRKGRRWRLLVYLYDSNGRRILAKSYRLKRPRLPASVASRLAGMMAAKLGAKPQEVAEQIQTPAQQPAQATASSPSPAQATTGRPSGTGSGVPDSALPAWARGTETAPSPQPSPAAEVPPPPPSAPAAPEAESRDVLRFKKRRKLGAVPDVLVAAGMSLNLRAGLTPRHESGLYPGIHADLVMFMRPLADVVVVRDLGLSASFNMGLGLKYGPQNSEDSWSSTMYQWRAGLVYRLGFDTTTNPTLLFDIGYGSTVNTISTDSSIAHDVSYSSPHAGLEVRLALWEPYLRFGAGGSFLFLVAGGNDVSGTGWGFSARAVLELVLFEQLHSGIGYELLQFNGLNILGVGVSDTFQQLFVRVGWSFH